MVHRFCLFFNCFMCNVFNDIKIHFSHQWCSQCHVQAEVRLWVYVSVVQHSCVQNIVVCNICSKEPEHVVIRSCVSVPVAVVSLLSPVWISAWLQREPFSLIFHSSFESVVPLLCLYLTMYSNYLGTLLDRANTSRTEGGNAETGRNMENKTQTNIATEFVWINFKWACGTQAFILICMKQRQSQAIQMLKCGLKTCTKGCFFNK